jgi:hypothetical protein
MVFWRRSESCPWSPALRYGLRVSVLMKIAA